jgi:transmembrane sensor
MSDLARIKHLFNLYIQNRCNEAEIKELFKLLKQYPATNQLDAELTDLWNTIDTEETSYEPNWDQLYQNVSNTPTPQNKVTTIKLIQKSWNFAAAAAVFIGVFFALLFTVFQRNTPHVNYITYTVPFKTTKTLILADGSKVVLNAGTTIRYPQSFTGKTREVSLNGEAYFQVAHLTDKPFIVHSGKLQTQVLGTSFNVDAYAKASALQVSVVSGKVAVKEASTGKQLMLVANQQATLNGTTNSFEKTIISDAENAIAWQEGKLIFEDASLDEIATELSLKFGIQTRLSNDRLKNCRISAVFQHKSLPQILTVITRLTGSSYTLNNSNAVISGKGCSSNPNSLN